MNLPEFVTFISGDTCHLNASECHPLALCSTPSTTNPSTQLLDLHLTTGALYSCPLGTSFDSGSHVMGTCYHLLTLAT